jgi:hypothetical protein
MKNVKGLTEAEAIQLMFAEVGGGWISISLLADLTPKQLKTAHLDYRQEEGHIIYVWLNQGEFATLAAGSRMKESRRCFRTTSNLKRTPKTIKT